MRQRALHRPARVVLVLAFVMTLALALIWWWSTIENLFVGRRALSSVALCFEEASSVPHSGQVRGVARQS